MDSSQAPDRDPNQSDPALENEAATSEPAESSSAEADGFHAADEPAPLTPVAWLKANAVYFVIIGGIVGWIAYKNGVAGLIQTGAILLGLGFVIFIHELGHFLAAKWCDVHVMTFSIGFGPAIPGCSFRRGETLYKVSLLPLGGYVNMVGEGTEPEEDEDYPRSFKNKSVGQRMVIISAGVIMNVLFGAAVFIVIYMTRGMLRLPADVWQVDAGSPAWQAGVRDDSQVKQVGDKKNPHFEELKLKVMLSGPDKSIPFVLGRVGRPETVDRRIQPQLNGQQHATVGIICPPRVLELMIPEKYSWVAFYDKAAGAARPIPFPLDAVVLEMTDPGNPAGMSKLKPKEDGQSWNYDDFAARLLKLRGKDIQVKVRLGDGTEQVVELPNEGFKDGDTIVETSAAKTPYNPLTLSDLGLDPRYLNDSDAEKRNRRNPYEFRKRLRQLADEPMLIGVRRKGASESELTTLFVPPAYHASLGLQMRMGEVVALRSIPEGSTDLKDAPATRAGVKTGDVISHVVMRVKGAKEPFLTLDDPDIDPIRLPFELSRAAAAHQGKEVEVLLSVRRLNPQTREKLAKHDIAPMPWDFRWQHHNEVPLGGGSPLSIPELGVAYHVTNLIYKVKPDSPAAKAGLKPDFVIEAIRFKDAQEEPGKGEWGSWMELSVEEGSEEDPAYRWAFVHDTLQARTLKDVQIKVRPLGQKDKEPEEKELTATPDPDWPSPDRGALAVLKPDTYFDRASDPWQALAKGTTDTIQKIQMLYLIVGKLVSGGLSTKNLGGPVQIVSSGYSAAADFYDFLYFLAFISVNLAVINFLPIPLLDGGHMVFLIYEKIRGKPAPESVRVVATYIGIILLFSLIAFVTYNDIKRQFF